MEVMIATTILSANSTSSDLQVYPNPADKFLHINGGRSPVDAVIIYDTSGKVVLRKQITSQDQEVSIEIETLGSGIYLIGLKSTSGIQYRGSSKIRAS